MKPQRYSITFERNGRQHTVSTTDVEEALHGTYGILSSKTGHLNKIIEIKEK